MTTPTTVACYIVVIKGGLHTPSSSLSSWHLPTQLGAEVSERHSGADTHSLSCGVRTGLLCDCTEGSDGRAAPATVNSELNMLCLMRYIYLNAHRIVVEFMILLI